MGNEEVDTGTVLVGAQKRIGELHARKSGFWFNFACFGFKICFLKKLRDRSVSFFGQETHEHVKTIKKHCLEAKNNIFSKNAFENRYVFLGGFPPGGAATHRRVFCLDFFGMFRALLKCLALFFEMLKFIKIFRLKTDLLDLKT